MLNRELLTPEAGLLLEIMRGEYKAGKQPVDCERFFRLSQRHRLTSYFCMRRAGLLALLPDDLRSRLAAENARNAVLQLQNIAVAERVLDDLAATGIMALVVKGAPLAQLLYGDPGARMSRDIDLLVDARHYAAAVARMKKNGFRLKTLPTATHSVWLGENGVVVELHSRLSIFGMGAGWLRGTDNMKFPVASIAGRDYRLPQPDEYFVYLCWHGASHGWYRLLWLLDIEQLLQNGMVQADNALRLARRYGLENVCGQALLLARELTGVELPDSLQIPGASARLAREAFELAVASNRSLDECFDYTASPLRELRYQMAVQGTWKAQLQFLFEPTVEDRRQIELPENLQWLYRGMRPALLALRATRKKLSGTFATWTK